MNLLIPRHELKAAIQGLSRVVSRKSTLPVLQHVRIAVEEGKASVSVTDLDSSLTYRFQDASCDGLGVMLVPFSELQPLTKGKDVDPVEIATTDDGLVTITNTVAGQSIARTITGLDPKEWPSLPAGVPVASVDTAFLTHIQRAASFVSTDETRYVLTGVYLDIGKDGDYLVATDGRRMTAINSPKLPIAESCIVPATKFITWNKLTGDPSIGCASGWFRLVTDTWDYRARTIDGAYPNWRQVVPAESGKQRLEFSEESVTLLSSVLPTFAGHATFNATVTLSATAGKVTLRGCGENDPQPSTLELVGCTMTPGATISVSRWYLLDALAAGFRSFAFSDSASPLVAHDPAGIHVLMPQRTVAEPENAPKPTPQPAKDPMPKPTESPSTQTVPQLSALDRVLVAYEQAKSKVREANEALSGVASAVREALKEDKQRRAEIDSVRAGLARLQAIKV